MRVGRCNNLSVGVRSLGHARDNAPRLKSASSHNPWPEDWGFGMTLISPHCRIRAKHSTPSRLASGGRVRGEFKLSICHEELAINSCTSRSTVCKVLTRLQNEGIMQLGYPEVRAMRRAYSSRRSECNQRASNEIPLSALSPTARHLRLSSLTFPPATC